MTQTLTPTAPNAWLQALQLKLMAALDAAWSLIDGDADPAAIRQARDKAKAIGELAAVARKVAGMAPARKPSPAFAGFPEPPEPEDHRPSRGLDRLKGGGRGRL